MNIIYGDRKHMQIKVEEVSGRDLNKVLDT